MEGEENEKLGENVGTQEILNRERVSVEEANISSLKLII